MNEEINEEELIALMAARITAAETRMINNLNADLFAGDVTPLTPEQIKEYEKYQRRQKLLAPWYWLRCRIIGAWNLLIYGQCNQCERDD